MTWGPLGSMLPLIYDPEDRELIQGNRWCLTNGYPSRRRGGRIQYLHILIAGEVEGMEVDHKNGDHFDVRRENFRHVPHKHNTQNLTRLHGNNTSGYRGVSFDKKRGLWRAYAGIDGRIYALGRFDSADSAHQVATQFRLNHMPGALS